MKKLLVLLSIFALNGCAVYDAYFMAKFDNNEYKLINDIRTKANLGAAKCGTDDAIVAVDDLYRTTVEFRNYAEYIPHNEEVIRLSKEFSEMAKTFSEHYHTTPKVSTTYCTIKFGSLEKNAVIVQNVVGRKPK